MTYYYTLYKTTDLLNNKSYIGIHKTKDLDDNYLGSGYNLKLAIKKYGKINFKKEILMLFDSRKSALNAERIIVNKEFIKLNSNYNIRTGGQGSWDHINIPGKVPWNKGIPMREESKIKLSIANKGKPGLKGEKNGMFGKIGPNRGKELSKETRAKLSAKRKKRIICIETQEIFDSLTEAALAYNGHKTTISGQIHGRQKIAYGYHWKILT